MENNDVLDVIHALMWFLFVCLGLGFIFTWQYEIPPADVRYTLSDVENEVINIREIYQYELDHMSYELERVRIENADLILQKGDGMHRPSLREMNDFLRRDDTDMDIYVIGEYECIEFSNTLVGRLYDSGIFACSAFLKYADGTGHAMVAVRTEEGVVYIEPQTDEVFIYVPENYSGLRVNQVSSCYGTDIRYEII